MAKLPARIAVVACGYGDGYPCSMPDGAPVCIEGRYTKLIGAVSMDMLTIDITGIPSVDVGSKVELWGKHINVNVLASLCGTIGCELICGIVSRVPYKLS